MPAELDRLRAAIEAMTARPWRVPYDEPLVLDEEDAAGAETLVNVAPELLACVEALATLREDALADLVHYRARATGGQVARLPQYTASQATRIERETRCLDALDARIREARAGDGDA
jgi:hypothetical protein